MDEIVQVKMVGSNRNRLRKDALKTNIPLTEH